MKRGLTTTLLILTISFSIGQTVFEEYYDGEVYVKIKQGVPVSGQPGENSFVSLNEIPFLMPYIREFGLTSARLPFHWSSSEVLKQVYQFNFSEHNKVSELIRSLEKLDIVEYAEMIPIYRPCFTPNDPRHSTQWHMTKVVASKAWDIHKGNGNIIIGDVDTQFDVSHEDLKNALWINPGEIAGNGIDDDGNGFKDDINGWDLADNDNDLYTNWTTAHGTHTAGICGASTNNALGVSSIAYDAKLLLVKVSVTSNDVKYAAEGVTYAAENGAKVINMSWGGTGMSGVYKSVIDNAYSKGILLVAAAGNSGQETTFYPAGFANVIGVANTTNSDAKHSSSQYGTWVKVSAPGSAILSTINGNKYTSYTGSSMAAPVVSSLAALMRSYNPYATVAQVTQCILDNCDKIDNANPDYIGKLGKGRINAEKAMICMKTKYPATVSINESGKENTLKLFPNPAKDFITISGTTDQEIKIYDVLGQVLIHEKGKVGSMNISIEKLSAGLYYINSGNKNISFVKE